MKWNLATLTLHLRDTFCIDWQLSLFKDVAIADYYFQCVGSFFDMGKWRNVNNFQDNGLIMLKFGGQGYCLKFEFKFIRKFFMYDVIMMTTHLNMWEWKMLIWGHFKSYLLFKTSYKNIWLCKIWLCLHKRKRCYEGETKSSFSFKFQRIGGHFGKWHHFCLFQWSYFWHHGIFQIVSTREASDANMVLLSSQSTSCHFIVLTE